MKLYFLSAFFGAIIAVMVIIIMIPGSSHTPSSASLKESALDRVLRTGTIRCAYFVYPPEMVKDPNTGALSGYVYDLVNEIGRVLNLKVEWTTEVALVGAFEGVKRGQFDSLCSGMGETPGRAREVVFATPTNYTHIYAWARIGDHRFQNNLDLINDSSVKIAVLEGEGSQIIAQARYPKAQQVAIMAMNEIQMTLEQVATKKADIALMQKKAASIFIQSRPETVSLANPRPFLSVIQTVMAFDTSEIELKNMIDAAIRSMHMNGFIERTFRRYDPNLETYQLPLPDYLVGHDGADLNKK